MQKEQSPGNKTGRNILLFSGFADAAIGSFLLFRYTLSNPFGVVGLVLIIIGPLVGWYAWTRLGGKVEDGRK